MAWPVDPEHERLLDEYIVALGGTPQTPDSARSLLLKSEGPDLYQGPERDPDRIGSAEWWQPLDAVLENPVPGIYGSCSRCGAEVGLEGLVKTENVDGTSAIDEPPYIMVCGRKPCVILA